jgi:hypothetical protein
MICLEKTLGSQQYAFIFFQDKLGGEIGAAILLAASPASRSSRRLD